MSFSHGSKASLWVTFSGVLTDVSAYLDNSGVDESADTAEVTTFGSTAKAYIPGLKDGKLSLSGPFDPTTDVGFATQLGGTASAIEFYPAGKTSGLPKHYGNAICTSYNVTSSVGDANKVSVEYQFTGGVTRGTAT